MRLCAITDRKSLGPEVRGSSLPERAADLDEALLHLTSGWISAGVDLIQLREKDLDTRALRRLAEKILEVPDRRHCRLLINLPLAEAPLREVAPVADGIHIPGRPAPGAVDSVRRAFRAVGREAIVSLSCHTVEEVRIAWEQRADMVLFAPVFEKVPSPQGRTAMAYSGQGLDALRIACEAAKDMPVFALGGVTVENAASCERAGATGIAGIRLFARNDWRSLRAASTRQEPALPFQAARSTDI